MLISNWIKDASRRIAAVFEHAGELIEASGDWVPALSPR